MSHYRKKPVTVEARRLPQALEDFHRDFLAELAEWCGGVISGHALTIRTLEGDMTAMPGDWIIRGVQGEFYPCKPDIFEQTYEPAEAPV